MTDGAARLLELNGNSTVKQDVVPKLTSRDPTLAFTSGQWMTERPGGSDVSQTETTATPTGVNHAYGPEYKLDGFKWFSSATDSDVALVLARTGPHNSGSRGLSLFLVPLRPLPLPSNGTVLTNNNNILIHRLKNKIGTHALPTAELELSSTVGYLVGPVNQGVKSITPILNITRVYSAVHSVGALRRCLAIATAYANVRVIPSSGKLLKDTPIHVASLATVSITYRAIAHLVFGVVRLLGKVECDVASLAEKAILRVLTPTVKAFAAEMVCAGAEECMSALGGLGYMEEVGIGRVIRDVLVERIWEGTTTVLALDLARATKDPLAVNSLMDFGRSTVNSLPVDLLPNHPDLQAALSTLTAALDVVSTVYRPPFPELVLRPALMLVGHLAASIYLLKHAVWSTTQARDHDHHNMDVEVFCRWVLEGGMVPVLASVRHIRGMSTGETARRSSVDNAVVFGRTTLTSRL